MLQSVTVAMSGDGTVTALNSTAVATAGAAAQSTSSTRPFSPAEAASDLPFRILTAYRTADRAGTNLAELAGYTGPITIDITVQNLTARPQEVTYDSAGASKSEVALVGVPLTVVASAELDATSPDAVVTNGTDDAVTNGVLSQTSNGHAVIQWATVLAPPQLRSSETLRLVVNAKDFKVPTVNLSAQPGLIADPSVGALLDSAFSPNSSKQLELQTQTIELISDVNEVLARASKDVSKVRRNLNDTSKTLGTKSVADLKSSTKQIATSMKSLDGRVKALGGELSSNLTTTKSSVLTLLDETVTTVDQALGDTSATAPTVTTSGSGCGTTVTANSSDTSLYGSLLRVSAQLDGYSKTTGACRDAIQQELVATVGPAEPTTEACASSTSVTCSLFQLKAEFTQIAEKLVSDGEAAAASLDSAAMSGATDAYATLSADIDAVVAQTANLSGGTSGNVDDLLDDLADILGTSSISGTMLTHITALSGQIDELHTTAVQGKAALTDLQNTKTSLKSKVCALVSSGDLTAAKAQDLLGTLSGSDCDNNAIPGAPTATLESQLAQQAQAWDKILAATATTDTTAGLGKAIADLKQDVSNAQAKLAAAREADGTNQGNRARAIAEMRTKVTALKEADTTMAARMTRLQTQQANLESTIKTAFANAADEATAAAAAAIDSKVRTLAEQTTANSAALNEMFTRSAAGLSATATDITTDGAKVVDTQKAQVTAAAKEASTTISTQVTDDLAQISTSVGASSKDLEGANTLLTNDLRRVLLDLGTRKVKGSGLLGAMATSAATANSADYQLALASAQTTSYANVRSSDVDGIMLRQAQITASLEALASLPAFKIEVPAGAEHRTVYSIQLNGSK